MGIILSSIYNTARNIPTAAPAIKAMAGASAVVTGLMAHAGAQSAGAPGAIIMTGMFGFGCLALTSIMDMHERTERVPAIMPASPTPGNGPA